MYIGIVEWGCLRKDIRDEEARFVAQFEFEAVVVEFLFRITVRNLRVLVAVWIDIATADLATLAINLGVVFEAIGD